MRTFIFSTFLCGATLFSGNAFAQVGGPVLGYLPEGTAIRSLYGIPGAGAIGSTIATGRSFSLSAVSPQQDYILTVAADTGEVMVMTPATKNLATISGAAANPTLLSMSPTGSAAALWYPVTGQLQIVSGLPLTPTVRSIDASFLNASPLSLAVSDDGQWSVGLWFSGVYAFGPSAQVIPLQTDPGVVALSFYHGNHTLALAAANRATSITDVGGSTQAGVLFNYSQQGLTPRAIGVSFDNKLAVVADATGKLVTIAMASGSATTIDCGCAPTGLYGLGGAVFRLNGGGTGRNGSKTELKVFDAAPGSVFIVPPAFTPSAGGRQ